MRKLASAFFVFLAFNVIAQPLQDINYNYQYYPDHEFSFLLKPVNKSTHWLIAYQLTVSDTSRKTSDYVVQWQGRESLSAKEGSAISVEPLELSRTSSEVTANFSLTLDEAPAFLVAKVINTTLKRAWLFYVRLDKTYPTDAIVLSRNKPVLKKYVLKDQPLKLETAKVGEHIVSYYNDDFPAAPPGFSERQAKVARAMKPDSVFMLSGDQALIPFANGLFLIQHDTTSAQGIAFRAEDDYPKYAKAQNLAGPLVYICTKAEYNQLEQAKGNKKAFDRTVLTITGDVERAKLLIRNYFRRVELANEYFTSYKEGWKTDRGMIYIIFGFPDEVFKFSDREVWKYKTEPRETTFTFVHTGTLFDPDNFVLIRDAKYTEKWYEVVNLWRNQRF